MTSVVGSATAAGPGPGEQRPGPRRGASALAASLWRHKVAFVTCTVAGLVLGFVFSGMQPTRYTAESRVFLSSQSSFDPLGQRDFVNDPSRYLDQQAALMTSQPLLRRAIQMGAPAAGVEELRDALEVVASRDSDILAVSATADTAEHAVEQVDGVVAAYREYQSSLVKQRVADLEALNEDPESTMLQQQATVFGDGVELAEDPIANAQTSTIRNVLLLGIVGALLGLGVAVVLDAFPQALSRRHLRPRVSMKSRKKPAPQVPNAPTQPRPASPRQEPSRTGANGTSKRAPQRQPASKR